MTINGIEFVKRPNGKCKLFIRHDDKYDDEITTKYFYHKAIADGVELTDEDIADEIIRIVNNKIKIIEDSNLTDKQKESQKLSLQTKEAAKIFETQAKNRLIHIEAKQKAITQMNKLKSGFSVFIKKLVKEVI